jgi:hypothetical protein
LRYSRKGAQSAPFLEGFKYIRRSLMSDCIVTEGGDYLTTEEGDFFVTSGGLRLPIAKLQSSLLRTAAFACSLFRTAAFTSPLTLEEIIDV